MPSATDEANFVAIAAGESFDLFFAVKIELSSPIRLWNGLVDKTIDGETYTGLGSLLGIGEVEETSEIASKGVTLSLSGVPPSILSLALGETYYGKRVEILLGASSGNRQGLTTIFSGYADEATIEDSGSDTTITVKAESALARLGRAEVSRYTAEWQKARFPMDPSFEFVPSLQRTAIVWGRTGNGRLERSSI